MRVAIKVNPVMLCHAMSTFCFCPVGNVLSVYVWLAQSESDQLAMYNDQLALFCLSMFGKHSLKVNS